ncbi:hypothetical protein BCR33DRAFT_712438 [Rhizoclosmatium globosum]|uniref:Uncharacterized protein n=1 Tax=Rhizoclosmatium globosum TaxID=329046 RepID=A0A1Y2CWF8_9FUNG|nr:hypothetical protein BCR33DRAFT_712438 [Rhizoclosmatium globosum]|eukprot:ORY51358.1 hypothetical protein BCR33DRAFT_712438 [Rhizoclosmatium globosum]
MSFNPDTIQAIFKQATNNPDFKMSKDALPVSCELLTVFTTELVMRSLQQSMQRRNSLHKGKGPESEPVVIDVGSLERVLPQLLLDFN